MQFPNSNTTTIQYVNTKHDDPKSEINTLIQLHHDFELYFQLDFQLSSYSFSSTCSYTATFSCTASRYRSQDANFEVQVVSQNIIMFYFGCSTGLAANLSLNIDSS